MALIAEGLATRKDRLAESRDLQTRIAAAAVRYEDDDVKDADDPNELLARLEQVFEEIQQLNVRINATNNVTKFKFDRKEYTLMEAIALRERLIMEQRAHRSIADSASVSARGWGGRTKDDIKQVSRIDAKAQRKKADAAAERVRRLDLDIQKVNWSTELV